MPTRFGQGLKDWRRRRDMSQMRLGLAANVSARHIAFLETGRSNPTRGMVIRLAEALGMPRSERNSLLEAAGFAAAYARRDLATEEMASVRAALDWTLDRHAPYPGFAIDRHWRLFASNAPAQRLFDSVGLGLGASLIEAFAEPSPLRDAILNWPDLAQHMMARLRTESRQVGGDPVLEDAARRIASDSGVEEHGNGRGLLPAVVTTRFRMGPVTLSFFSTIAQFGSAEDIALADLRIELLFPLDDETRQMLMAAASAARQ